MNSDKSGIFFTSDWHLYHAASIKFDQRPFKDLEEMHEALIRRFNSCVNKNSVTYFLGDLGIGSPQEINKIIKRLNGDKIMILGNHDKKGFSRYRTMGFVTVINNFSFYIGDQKVTASHCPLLDTFREDTTNMKGALKGGIEPWHGHSRLKHRACSMKNEGQFHLHGHIHARKGVEKSKKILGRQYDVGVPGNNYTPVSLSTIESWVAKTLILENQ